MGRRLGARFALVWLGCSLIGAGPGVVGAAEGPPAVDVVLQDIVAAPVALNAPEGTAQPRAKQPAPASAESAAPSAPRARQESKGAQTTPKPPDGKASPTSVEKTANEAGKQEPSTSPKSKSGDESRKDKEPAKSSAAKPAPEAPPRPKPTLSPQMAALRDQVRRVLVAHFGQPLNTNDNTPAQVLQFCLAFGCDTEIRYGSAAGSAVSGIGCLCYNYPCAGYQMLLVDGKRVVARLGYGLQQSPGQMLAVLAQSSVPESYELRVGEWRGTVADLVESEKLGCIGGIDLSQKLIALAHYLSDSASWKNASGDDWSLERMVQEELKRSPSSDGPEAIRHVMGLTHALERHARAGQPLQGQYERARKYVDEYREFALGLQNPDGTWHPAFFAAKGPSRDALGVLRATGQILEWLAMALPEQRLQDRRVLASVSYVANLLESPYARLNVSNSSPQEMEAVMHALHALRVYDRRAFQPADPEKTEPAGASKGAEKQGSGGEGERGSERVKE